jgi:hypothetical protein
MKSPTLLALCAALVFAVPGFAQDGASSNANTEILMQKIKADKKLLVASNMDLTDAEAKNFWPVYDAYQKELGELNQRLVQTIKEYADSFNKGPISDDTAKKLMNEVLSIEEAEVKAKRATAEKVGKVLPAAKTARYTQIETKIRSVLKAELAANIPLVY